MVAFLVPEAGLSVWLSVVNPSRVRRSCTIRRGGFSVEWPSPSPVSLSATARIDTIGVSKE